MLFKTKGIVLHTTDYSESSIIAKIFTEKFGQQSYLVNAVRSKKAKSKSSLFQPLTIVDMVVYHQIDKGLQRIGEINHANQYKTITTDIVKSAIALFMAEVVYKSIKEQESNPDLFHFLETAISFLDEHTLSFANYPSFVLIQLTKYLGSFPENNFSTSSPYFDLAEGKFVSEVKFPTQTLTITESETLNRFLKLRFENFDQLKITGIERKKLLFNLITYYHMHHTHGSNLKSHLVLEEVFE